MRFSNRSLTAIKPRAVRYWVNDETLPGFRLSVSPSGVKSFAVRIRSRGGRKHRTDSMQVIGHLGELTLDQARNKARELLSRVTLGDDPAAKQRETRTAETVAELSERFLEERTGKLKPSTVHEYRRLFKMEINPTFGSSALRVVSRHDVARLHYGKRKTPYLANRMLALLGAFFRWADVRGYALEGNRPTLGVEPFPEKGRERYLTEGEIKVLGETLRRAEREGVPPDPKRALYSSKRRPKKTKRGKESDVKLTPANPYAINAIRLLLLSGWRESEALSLRWDAVDLEGRRARLADTKTGLSWRPIGAAAVELLRAVPHVKGSPFVFPGQSSDAPLTDIKHVWHAVRHAAKLETLRLHDLRHHFASIGAQSGISLLALGAVLGHRELATTKKYAHLGDDPTKRAADEISASISIQLNQVVKSLPQIGNTGGRPKPREQAPIVRTAQIP